MSKLVSALHFAANKHSNQRRKDKEETPYINHPISVVNFINSSLLETKSIGKEFSQEDVEIILSSASLHDTVEDTNTTYEELVDNFGETIANIVIECSDDKSLPGWKRKILQIENAPKKSLFASIVKIGDKWHNVSSIDIDIPTVWDHTRKVRYLDWAERVITNIGHNEKDIIIYMKNKFFDIIKEKRKVLCPEKSEYSTDQQETT